MVPGRLQLRITVKVEALAIGEPVVAQPRPAVQVGRQVFPLKICIDAALEHGVAPGQIDVVFQVVAFLDRVRLV